MKYKKLNLYRAKPGTPGGYAHVIDATDGKVKFVIADQDASGRVSFSKAQGTYTLPEAEFLKLFEECKAQKMLCIDL